MKRLLDVCVAGTGLILLVPVMAATAVAIRLILGRPVLFKQVRPGLAGEPFTLVKFRTMRDLQSRNGTLVPDAERLTPLGRFLRASSLDELPTLWNVLKGDMSLVGPRPLLMEYLPLYNAEQRRRHEIRPGITGWAQIHGRNALSWEQRFKLDVWYVDNRSFWLDVRILAATILKVVRREGVTQPGRATADPFVGRDL
jgi:sugar transferase EpsL